MYHARKILSAPCAACIGTRLVKGPRDIVVHNSLPLLDRGAASATGIMPHIHVSGYFRLTVPADEVIE